MRAAMGHPERLRPEFTAGFKAENDKANLDWRRTLGTLDRIRDVSLAEFNHRRRKLQRASKELEEIVLSCRSREAATKAQVSVFRELASAKNPGSLEVAPSISRRRDETSRTEPNAPLDPASLDFAGPAYKETTKFEPTFGLRGGMDEFRRLKGMHPNASPRELAEIQVFAKAVARCREDGRGSKGHGGDYREDRGEDQRRGRHSSRKDSKNSRERRPPARTSTVPR